MMMDKMRLPYIVVAMILRKGYTIIRRTKTENSILFALMKYSLIVNN